jgi:hypothetical protein
MKRQAVIPNNADREFRIALLLNPIFALAGRDSAISPARQRKNTA